MTISERIDAVTLVEGEYLNTVLPAPKSVKIELTARCNLRCNFCSLRNREVQPKDDMPIEFFKRITTEMRDAGVEEIGCFYIGESCMAPDLLVDAILWCKQELRFPYVFLTTNGSLLEPKLAYRVMAAGLDSLKFSINAADEEQYHAIMGVKGALFHRVLRNLKWAKILRDDSGYKCGIYASSIKYDGEQQKRMEAMLAEFVLPYVDEHYWLPLFNEMAAVTKERAAELGFEPKAGNQGRSDMLRDPLPCWAVFKEAHVRYDGHLSACCFGADNKFDMGDLNQQPFMDAWNSTVFQQLRTAHLAKDVTGTSCEGCIAYLGV